MCLHTKQTVPFFLKTDIIVYKNISKDNKPMFMSSSLVYKPNRSYDLRERIFWVIPIGFHKSLEFESPYYYNLHNFVDIGGIRNYMRIEVGFHAYTSLGKAIKELNESEDEYFKTVKFTIPAGSEVAYGINLDIVSNRIISGDLVAL